FSPRSFDKTDFATVLTQTIGAIELDPAQLRNAVYELSRIKLQTECSKYPPLAVLETRRILLAFEAAVERIETASSEDGFVSLEVLADLDAKPECAVEERPPEIHDDGPIVLKDQSIPAFQVPRDQRGSRQGRAGKWVPS